MQGESEARHEQIAGVCRKWPDSVAGEAIDHAFARKNHIGDPLLQKSKQSVRKVAIFRGQKARARALGPPLRVG